MINKPIVIGSRGSRLALWQANYVADLLRASQLERTVEIVIFTTRGDQAIDTPLPMIGGKGLFTAELEAALREGQIDLAVHSLKDLPTDDPNGLTVGAIPQRAPVNDVLVSGKGYTLNALPPGATVGTSSRRRAAQLLARRPDLITADVRGNVPTRVQKARRADSLYDAIVLALAGLDRLDMRDAISDVLPLDVMLPAPGQGALGIQCRADGDSQAMLAPLDDRETRLAVSAERAFLGGLGGGCSVPVAAYASVEGAINLRGRVSAVDGSRQIEVLGSTNDLSAQAARNLGQKLADRARQQGADDILEAANG